jgi:O-antigen/teichoic acid export membrane protein
MSTNGAGVPSSRSLFKNILRSSGLYAIAAIGQPLVGMLMLPIITRYLRPADYGVLATLEQVSSVLALLLGANFGTMIGYFYFQRDTAETRRPVVGTCVLGSGLAGILTMLVLGLMGAFLTHQIIGRQVSALYLQVIALGMPIGFASETLFAWLRVADRPRAYLAASLLRIATGAVAAILLVAVFHLKILGMVLSGIAAVTVPALILAAICWRVARPTFDGRLFLRMVKYAAPIGVSALAMFCTNFGDRLILPRYVSMADIGLYNLAYKIGMLASLAYSAFHTYWSSQIFGVMKRDDADTMFARLLTYAFGGVGAMVLGLIVFAKPAIHLLAHRDYSGAAALVPIIATAYGFRSLGDFFRSRYYLAGHPGYDAIANWLGAGLCLGGYLVWIPRFGVWGAAFATLLAFCSVLAVTLIWTFRLRPYEVEAGRLAKIAIALAAVLGLFMALPVASLVGQIAFGTLLAAGYPGLLWLFGFPTPAEREAVRVGIRRVVDGGWLYNRSTLGRPDGK